MDKIILEKLQHIERMLATTTKTVLTLDEVAELTNLSRSRIYRLTSTRQIPHSKRGHTLYFSRPEIEKWMLGNRVQTRTESQQFAERYDLNN